MSMDVRFCWQGYSPDEGERKVVLKIGEKIYSTVIPENLHREDCVALKIWDKTTKAYYDFLQLDLVGLKDLSLRTVRGDGVLNRRERSKDRARFYVHMTLLNDGNVLYSVVRDTRPEWMTSRGK